MWWSCTLRVQPTRRGVERARPLLVAGLRELTTYRLATTCPFRSRPPQREISQRAPHVSPASDLLAGMRPRARCTTPLARSECAEDLGRPHRSATARHRLPPPPPNISIGDCASCSTGCNKLHDLDRRRAPGDLQLGDLAAGLDPVRPAVAAVERRPADLRVQDRRSSARWPGALVRRASRAERAHNPDGTRSIRDGHIVRD